MLVMHFEHIPWISVFIDFSVISDSELSNQDQIDDMLFVGDDYMYRNSFCVLF